jgi:hypothetical protein
MLLVNCFSTVEVASLLWGLPAVGTTHLSLTPWTTLKHLATRLCLPVLGTNIWSVVGFGAWRLFVDGLLFGAHVRETPHPPGDTKSPVRVRGRQHSGLSDVPDREMTAGTDAGVTPDSHARPVLSVDRCDALGVEDRRVALVGSAGHMVG